MTRQLASQLSGVGLGTTTPRAAASPAALAAVIKHDTLDKRASGIRLERKQRRMGGGSSNDAMTMAAEAAALNMVLPPARGSRRSEDGGDGGDGGAASNGGLTSRADGGDGGGDGRNEDGGTGIINDRLGAVPAARADDSEVSTDDDSDQAANEGHGRGQQAGGHDDHDDDDYVNAYHDHDDDAASPARDAYGFPVQDDDSKRVMRSESIIPGASRHARRARWLRFPPVSVGRGGHLEFDNLVEQGRRKYSAATATKRPGSAGAAAAAAGGGAGGGAGGEGGSPMAGGGSDLQAAQMRLQECFRDPLLYQRWRRKALLLERSRKNSRKSRAFIKGLKSFATSLKKRTGRGRGPLSQWDEYFTALVRKGIPEDLRGQMWRACSGADEMWADARNAGYQYDQILARAKQVPPPDADVIERDLYRTFPTNSNFDNEEGIGALRNVLLAYSTRNAAVGYCQSMNFLVAIFLLHMNEEETFWTLAAIVEQLTPEYYSKNMRGMHVDQRVFRSLVAEYLPKVSAKLEENYVEVAPISFQWFLCLYVNTLPLPVALRVWDCFFHEGTKVLFRVGVAILKVRENHSKYETRWRP